MHQLRCLVKSAIVAVVPDSDGPIKQGIEYAQKPLKEKRVRWQRHEIVAAAWVFAGVLLAAGVVIVFWQSPDPADRAGILAIVAAVGAGLAAWQVVFGFTRALAAQDAALAARRADEPTEGDPEEKCEQRVSSTYQLDEVDLRKARLAGVQLREADLTGARLEHVDFSTADLTEALLAEARLDDALLQAACLVKAKLNQARLSRADLRHARLTEADLTGARLDHAALCVARLRRAILRKADLREADLTGAILNEAKLNAADLRGADLSDAKLEGADFRAADLRGATFDAEAMRTADRDKHTKFDDGANPDKAA